MKKIDKDLKNMLDEIIKRNPYQGLLFSGGLDTSILAGLNSSVIAITVSLESWSDDIPYSESLAELLKMEHYHRRVSIDEAIEAIPETIRILKSFDPAIPNDLAVYFGLKFAKKLGIDRIATGDGSDELFGGYSFMRDIDDLEGYIKRIAEKMNFSSNDIGDFFGVRIIQPFIDKDIIDFVLHIPVDLKIRRYNGKIWGKWILRKAFEGTLPEDIVWQSKRPLEYGSGMNRLRQVVSDKVSNEEFKENTTFISFLNKEHYYYYKIYKEVVGEIPKPKADEKECPGCGAGMKKDGFHCGVCGYVLDWRHK
jgi:asparagine synthase (glutamine-hydrolysing)